MRILLQQKETQLYFQDIDAWTAHSRDAMDFGSSTKAIDFCLQNRLTNVQIVLKFEDQQYDIVLDALVDIKDPKAVRTARPP